jgi:hypothetical protein
MVTVSVSLLCPRPLPCCPLLFCQMDPKTYRSTITDTEFGVDFLHALHGDGSRRKLPLLSNSTAVLPLFGRRPSKSRHDHGCTHAINDHRFQVEEVMLDQCPLVRSSRRASRNFTPREPPPGTTDGKRHRPDVRGDG